MARSIQYALRRCSDQMNKIIFGKGGRLALSALLAAFSYGAAADVVTKDAPAGSVPVSAKERGNESAPKVVSFKDASKIKSWDAWNDHKKVEAPKEKPCVTWKKLNKLDPGLKEIGRLAVRGAKDIKSSKWSVGCETMDRDYADWNAYKHLLEPLGAKHGRLFSGWAKTEQEKG